MPNFVQEYRSTDLGFAATPLNGTAGSLTALLDAVLVNGGSTLPVTSVTESGTTYSAVIPADVTLENKDWLVIAGASPAGANGTVQITFIDSTHFSYQGPGGLGAITGTITYRRAPLGWSKPFVGTNVASYRCAVVPNCPQFYLRVDDSDTVLTTGRAREVCVRGYEVMSDVNTGTGPFPTPGQQVNGLCWRKSLTLDTVARSWVLIGDGATFYFIPNSDSSVSQGSQLNSFGAFTSYKPSDAYNAHIGGTSSFNAPTAGGGSVGLGYMQALGSSTPTTGLYLARALSQVAGAISCFNFHRWNWSAGPAGGPMNYIPYPAPVDGALWMEFCLLSEAGGSVISPRGRPRGLYTHCHNSNPFVNDFDTAINIAGLPGITLFSVGHHAGNQAGSAQFDRYGPW